MSSNINPTPYPYVNEAVQLLLENVRPVLKDNFLGLYLHGSLASGDFDAGHSDIDFLVVTNTILTYKITAELGKMHMHVRDSGVEWAKKLEGTYFSKKMLIRYRPSKRKIPCLNEGRFFLARQDIDWIINRHILRENGIVVAGPPIRPMIAPVSREEICWSVAQGIIVDWSTRTDDHDWLVPGARQPFIVLTCCRALYTLKHGTVKSKSVSARWALKALDKQWKTLIENAIAWRYGMPHGDIEKTLEMMRYGIEQSKMYLR